MAVAVGGAYLQITLFISPENRGRAVEEVYLPYKPRFLTEIPGALSKSLLVREEDVQVLHGFETREQAAAYLESDLFKEVAGLLSQLWSKEPEVRIYTIAGS